MLHVLFCLLFMSITFCASAEDRPATIENAMLRVEYDPAAGHFSVATRTPPGIFLTEGRFDSGGGVASAESVQHPVFGTGQAIVIRHADGGRDVIELFPG